MTPKYDILGKTPCTKTIGQKKSGIKCDKIKCRGEFFDTVLDWEHELPVDEFDTSFSESKTAKLNLVLGSSLQIQPANKIQKVGGCFV